MAAQIAHILAGEEALFRADPELAAAYGIGPGALALPALPGPENREVPGNGESHQAPSNSGGWFRLGCQGPDVFYHNQRTMPSGLHYGSLAHRKNYGLVVEGALQAFRELEGRPEDGATAWLIGFATHAALDRATHPYIVARAGWTSHSLPGSERYRSCHPFLERLLDLGLLAELRCLSGPEFGLSSLLPLPEEAAEPAVIGLLAAGLRRAFPRSTGSDSQLERRLQNAFSDALAFFSATDPARTAGRGSDYFRRWDEDNQARRLALIYPETIPAGLDFMNLRRDFWEHPAGDGRRSDESFLELYERGVEEATRVLRAVLRALRGEEPIAGISTAIGNGGLAITDPAGIPVPPRLADPLPLQELLEAELQRRKALPARP